MDLTPDVIFGLVRSDDHFPIDFDDAWKWIGYSTKGNAKVSFESAEFDDQRDFQVFMENHKNPKGGRPIERLKLTVECFKSFCMMAGTPGGRAVRRYFLDCEAELRLRIAQEQEAKKGRVLNAVVSEEHHGWEKRYEDEFFDEAYRITGWRKPMKGHPACMGRFINENVYDLFPDGTPERLKQVNPRNQNGNRSRKHHQHLTQPVGVSLLDFQKGLTIAVMRLSPANSPQSFKRNMSKACNGPIQLNLPYLEDLDVS